MSLKVTFEFGYGSAALLWFIGGILAWAVTGYFFQSIALSAACLLAGIAGFVHCLGRYAQNDAKAEEPHKKGIGHKVI